MNIGYIILCFIAIVCVKKTVYFNLYFNCVYCIISDILICSGFFIKTSLLVLIK